MSIIIFSTFKFSLKKDKTLKDNDQETEINACGEVGLGYG